MDLPAPVASGINTPNPLQSMNQFMDLAKSRQQLQIGKSVMTEQASKAAFAKQSQQEMQSALPLLKDPVGAGIMDDDGNVKDGAQKVLANAMPTTWKSHYDDFINAAKTKVETKKAVLGLGADVRSQIASQLGGVITNPRADTQDVNNALDNVESFYKGTPNEELVKKITGNLRNHNPQTVTGFVRSTLAPENLAGSGGLMTPQRGQIDTGAAVQPGAVAPALQGGGFTPAGPPVPKGIPPGFSVVTDPRTSNPYLINQQTGELRDMGYGFPGRPPGADPGQTAPSPAGPHAGPSGPPQSLPKPNYQGQGADVQNFQTEVHATRQAGDQVPLARNINQQILRLSADAKTGPGTDIWQHAIGAVGAPFGLSPTASYQEVGKFLEKNAINNMQAMGGPPSDARLSAAVAANGGPAFSREALQEVTKFNDATNTALGQYRQGIDHAVGMGKNVDYTNLPAFKAAWAQNFDVNVFKVENAIRDGDKAALARLKAELGPNGLRQLAIKRQNLNALSQTGQLPQQ